MQENVSKNISKEKLGTILAMLRIDRGYDVAELAELSRIGPGELIQIENGLKMPDSMTLHLLSVNLGVYPEGLLQGEVIPRKSLREINQELATITRLMEELAEQNRVYMDIIDGLVAGYPEILDVMQKAKEANNLPPCQQDDPFDKSTSCQQGTTRDKSTLCRDVTIPKEAGIHL